MLLSDLLCVKDERRLGVWDISYDDGMDGCRYELQMNALWLTRLGVGDSELQMLVHLSHGSLCLIWFRFSPLLEQECLRVSPSSRFLKDKENVRCAERVSCASLFPFHLSLSPSLSYPIPSSHHSVEPAVHDSPPLSANTKCNVAPPSRLYSAAVLSSAICLPP